jgi:hypothetical protein
LAKAAREAYERAVADLAAVALRLHENGLSAEEIARDVVRRRNELKQAFRAEDPADAVALMERRNIAKYGHRLGPTADQQFARYGSWANVIAAACRPSRLSDLL